MAIKYHKIRGVEKSVCTAEQKIAYNMAFVIYINRGAEYEKMTTAAEKSAARARWINYECESFKRNYPNNKTDLDGVFSALSAGLADYLTKEGFFIASRFEQIGKAFPALYM